MLFQRILHFFDKNLLSTICQNHLQLGCPDIGKWLNSLINHAVVEEQKQPQSLTAVPREGTINMMKLLSMRIRGI
jgi:hypothetical protein